MSDIPSTSRELTRSMKGNLSDENNDPVEKPPVFRNGSAEYSEERDSLEEMSGGSPSPTMTQGRKEVPTSSDFVIDHHTATSPRSLPAMPTRRSVNEGSASSRRSFPDYGRPPPSVAAWLTRIYGSQIEQLTARIGELETALGKATQHLKEDEETVEIWKQKVKDLEQEKKELKNERDQLVGEKSTKIAELEDEITRLRTEQVSNQMRNTLLQQQLSKSHDEIQAIQAQLQTVERERDRYKSAAEAARSDLASARGEVQRLETCLETQTQSHANELASVRGEQQTDRMLLNACTDHALSSRAMLDTRTIQLLRANATSEFQAERISQQGEQIERHRQEASRFNADRVFVFTQEQQRYLGGFHRSVQESYLRMRAEFVPEIRDLTSRNAALGRNNRQHARLREALLQKLCEAQACLFVSWIVTQMVVRVARRQITKAEANQILAEQKEKEAVEARISEVHGHMGRAERDTETIECLKQINRKQARLIEELWRKLGCTQAPQNDEINEVVASDPTSPDDSGNAAATSTSNDV